LEFIGKTNQFVTCSGDQTVRIWNADNGANVRNFGGNNDFLYAVGVSPDGSVVAAGGQEGVVRLYNGANAQLIKTLLPPGVTETPPKK
jgi:WD40 repeat protein